jgi:hypothetical protein
VKEGEIFYHPGGSITDDGQNITDEGWYFWDEGSYYHGPYETKELAELGLQEYFKQLG